ncbi:hypothetical protein HNP52_003121 [Sphingomonas kyeonggiensis]|uniref:LPXTG cell wall anchor domain-containing protein n=1 Tax=Sphingomonas kyeonggiensis TaxID=1268553 RepID=A0A7W7K2T5_9SPHN|nr:hypothetical protein [Sphingomonas kyeonggiensis]MBB4840029.1 hypothetical protein [Sphingomonas kyeonggiensis]
MRTTRAALFLGAAFLAVPAFAQDAPQQVTPPPIMTTPAPAPAPAAQPQVVIQPSAPVVQSIPSVEEQQRGAAAADAPAPAERRATATRTTTTRTTTTTTTRTAPAPARQAAPAPTAETPVAPPSPPVQTAPEPLPPQVEPAPAPEAAAPVTADTATTTEQTSSTSIAWPWLLGGVALLVAGLAVFLLARRRRNDEATTTDPVYVEPAYVAPVAVEPVAAPDAAVIVPPVNERIDPRVVPPAIEPVVAEQEAELADASKDDLAGVADATAPVAHRPWIELGLRPVSAGTTEEEAMVDFELTVGNSGDTEARNVRISSFMLADEAEGSEMERMLTERRADTIVPPVSIEPGDGTRVDAHLAVPKGDLGRVFNPVVVAEARYTLPDGSEARTAAAFRIGRPAYEGGIGAIGASRPHVTDDLAAELYGQPEHA